MRVRALAKINLSLRIVGSRPDGYHELRTVFQSIALHDELTIHRTRRSLELTCDEAGCPSDETNLVWRAADAVWRASGRSGAPRGIAIHLSKRIPMQAGLGGGSSDAAATVKALGRLWGVRRSTQRAIAVALGADVPFFLEGGTAYGTARGDLLFPLRDAPAAWVVLALPTFGISTKEAFAWFDGCAASRRRRPERSSASPDWRNDLEEVVTERHPEVAGLVRAMKRAGSTRAQMSGSGSAVFGLFAEHHAAIEAAAHIGARFPGTRAIVTRTVGRRTYRRLAGA